MSAIGDSRKKAETDSTQSVGRKSRASAPE
nr:MAG TPA: hypothetical protein [Caudoviricetes sp.]